MRLRDRAQHTIKYFVLQQYSYTALGTSRAGRPTYCRGWLKQVPRRIGNSESCCGKKTLLRNGYFRKRQVAQSVSYRRECSARFVQAGVLMWPINASIIEPCETYAAVPLLHVLSHLTDSWQQVRFQHQRTNQSRQSNTEKHPPQHISTQTLGTLTPSVPSAAAASIPPEDVLTIVASPTARNLSSTRVGTKRAMVPYAVSSKSSSEYAMLSPLSYPLPPSCELVPLSLRVDSRSSFWFAMPISDSRTGSGCTLGKASREEAEERYANAPRRGFSALTWRFWSGTAGEHGTTRLLPDTPDAHSSNSTAQQTEHRAFKLYLCCLLVEDRHKSNPRRACILFADRYLSLDEIFGTRTHTRQGEVSLDGCRTKLQGSGMRSTRTDDEPEDGWPSLLVVGLGSIGVEAALALAEAGECYLTLGDDAVATTAWRKTASCLLANGRSVAGTTGCWDEVTAGAGAMTRSQFMAAVLTCLSRRRVRTLSPVGDASVVERFAAVVMADPTLPHAVAFNEHVSYTQKHGTVG